MFGPRNAREKIQVLQVLNVGRVHSSPTCTTRHGPLKEKRRHQQVKRGHMITKGDENIGGRNYAAVRTNPLLHRSRKHRNYNFYRRFVFILLSVFDHVTDVSIAILSLVSLYVEKIFECLQVSEMCKSFYLKHLSPELLVRAI